VLRYLVAFAEAHGLKRFIRCNTTVVQVAPNETAGGWEITTYDSNMMEQSSRYETTAYDAVVVASGHYRTPRIPDNIPGLELFPGDVVHSRMYRQPGPYRQAGIQGGVLRRPLHPHSRPDPTIQRQKCDDSGRVCFWNGHC
jgi:cation diffusion facilitator CzcD-associated flavoprotein CzcO